MATATITNVQRFSLHDGGGIRTVAFVKGCPFRCPWCCNPENLSTKPQEVWHKSLCIGCSMRNGGFSGKVCPKSSKQCPTGAKELLGVERSAQDLADECLRDSVFFEESGGGVTLSGGECLMHEEFAEEFLRCCKGHGVHTAIETTLAVPLAHAEDLVSACGLFLVDFKIADGARSMRVTGIDPEVRDKNLGKAMGLGARVVGRMPIIPGFTDSRKNVEQNVAHMVELGITHVDVLPFHQLGEGKYDAAGMDYALKGVRQLSASDVELVLRLCESAGLHARANGG